MIKDAPSKYGKRVRLVHFAVIVSSAISLAGCASSHMKQYMGSTIQEVMLDSGPPINTMDMGDGTRAYQFRWGGGSVTVPATSRTTGMVNPNGQFTASTISTPAITHQSQGCVITYFARLDVKKDAWVVTDYRIPKEWFC